MKTTRWFPSLSIFRATARSASTSRRSAYRPSLESLEERQVPAVIQWTGAAGDNQWLTAGNWEGDQLPGAEDDVVISVAEDPTIVYAGGDTTINSLESAENIDLVSGTLTVLNGVNFTAGDLTESGGALEVPTMEILMVGLPEESEGTTEEELPAEEELPSEEELPTEEELPAEETKEPPSEETIELEVEITVVEDDPGEEPVREEEAPVDESTEIPDDVIYMTGAPQTPQPPVRRNTTTSVIIPPPASIQIDLQAASDTGASSTDNLTNRTAPVFDVTINQAGQVKIDWTGDGLWDVRQNFTNAGTYQFTAPGMQEGHRTITARLQPVAAVTPSLTTLVITIDTTGPRLIPQPSRNLPPVNSRSLSFTEALDPATITPDDVSVVLPDGSNAPVSGVIGSGANYMVQFGASSGWGQYEVRVGPDVRDLAGNKMDQDGDGIVGELIADVGVERFFVNRAPVLDSSGDMQFPAIPKNLRGHRGISVRKLLASTGSDRITDEDAGSKEGIAIIGADSTHGKWQFSMDGGLSWQRLVDVNDSAARLLFANRRTRLRFVPARDFVGVVDPGLTFRAWDRTAGVNGGTFAINSVGDASAFSAAIETASIEVTI